MLPDLERLIGLQDVETRAAAARKRIADAPVEIAALDARLAASTAAVAAVTAALGENQSGRRTLDRDLITAQQRLSKYKEQLMEVKTNPEYHAMQHQIQAAQAEVGRVEELILVNMLQADELTAALKAAEATLNTDAGAVAKERATIDAEASAQEHVLVACDRERGAIVAALSRQHFEMFERLLKARQGIAVAEAIDGHCSVCHVRLRPQVYNTVLKNDAIVHCDHCQRVLFFSGVHQRSAAGQAALDAAHARQDEHERPTP